MHVLVRFTKYHVVLLEVEVDAAEDLLESLQEVSLARVWRATDPEKVLLGSFPAEQPGHEFKQALTVASICNVLKTVTLFRRRVFLHVHL